MSGLNSIRTKTMVGFIARGCVGPERATDNGLTARVDVTEARGPDWTNAAVLCLLLPRLCELGPPKGSHRPAR
jgi:hypothetical protein